MSITTIIALISALAPEVEKYWPLIQQIVKTAGSIANALGITPADALKAASEIHLGLRLPTADEEKVMMDHASDVGPGGA